MIGKWSRLLSLLAGLAALNSATAPAQNLNPSAPLTLPTGPEVTVSPALPSGLLPTPSTATNPFTGLPCSTESSVATGGTETSPGTVPLPETGEPPVQLQAPTSVFGTQGSSGQC
jgi:hypothetical protein